MRVTDSQAFRDLSDGTYGLAYVGNENWRAQRRFAQHALKDVGAGSPTLAVSEPLSFLVVFAGTLT